MDKPNVPKLPKVAPVQFIHEVVSELKKVTWPTRQEAIKLTVVVIAISVLVGVFIGGLDSLLVLGQQVLFRK
jgi:preprotein translocase subunit SecE